MLHFKMPPKQQTDQPTSAKKKAKKCTKKADTPEPSPFGQEAKEEGQNAPKKKAKKLQSYDSRGCPHYVMPSEAANTGRKDAMMALGLEPRSISPCHNPNVEEDSEAEEESTSEPSEAAAIQLARQHTQAI